MGFLPLFFLIILENIWKSYSQSGLFSELNQSCRREDWCVDERQMTNICQSDCDCDGLRTCQKSDKNQPKCIGNKHQIKIF